MLSVADVMQERTTLELSSRPKHDGFIVMRSGETCSLLMQAPSPARTNCRSLHYGASARLRSRWQSMRMGKRAISCESWKCF